MSTCANPNGWNEREFAMILLDRMSKLATESGKRENNLADKLVYFHISRTLDAARSALRSTEFAIAYARESEDES